MKKAALIEIDGSHDECLYSQLCFLKQGGYHTTLICSDNLEKQVTDFDHTDEKVFFKLEGRSKLEQWRELWLIRNQIVNNGIRTVILNSTHGSRIRNFTLLPFPAATQFFGTLHGINKLKGSLTQKLISRKIKNYFLLNDYLKENLSLISVPGGLRFESYYPIFFPSFRNMPAISKPADEYWIGIPGQIEYKRRDYETLVKAFASLAVQPNYKFLLLGKSTHRDGNGKELKALIAQLGVKDRFVFWDGFMENGVFHAYLKQCDVIMPLIHPGNDGFDKYLIYQISGGYNLAFAYQKPLLMLKDFERYEDFRENAVFYELEQLGTVLSNLPEQVDRIKNGLYQQPKWSFGYQSRKYLDFID